MVASVTLGDVASLAGVSMTTASRAFNGSGRISEETRLRVLDVARRLDYRPHALARSFATGQSRVVGVILDNPTTFNTPILVGITSALGRQGLASLLVESHRSRDGREAAVAALNDRRVDGVLVLGHAAPYIEVDMFAGLRAPTVYVYGVRESADAAVFRADGRAAGELAARHLIGLGRRQIAHITAGDSPSAALRAKGFLNALRSEGMSIAGGAPVTGDWRRRTGIDGMEHLLRTGAEIDAIFCGNDQIAWGAYSVLRDRGIRVPDDIALIGYDHWTAILESQNNFMSTIDPNLRQLGEAATDFLVSSLGSSPLAGVYDVAPTLVPGVSTEGTGADCGNDDGELSLQLWIGSV